MRRHYKPHFDLGRAEAALDFLLALVIGIGLAVALVAWWTT